MSDGQIILGDCLEALPTLANGSVDFICCDLPYGTTQNKWDSLIPLDRLWQEYERVLKPNGAVALTCQMPFTITLGQSNLKWLKYEWVWNKVNRKTGHLNAKKQPLRVTESVLMFYREPPTYNPQMREGKPYKTTSRGRKSSNYGAQVDKVVTINEGQHYPVNLIAIPADERGTVGRLHPTQKPVALMEYLVKTYTNPGELVLDNCVGSGTTAVACINTGRKFIGIELDPEYYAVARRRRDKAVQEAYAKRTPKDV